MGLQKHAYTIRVPDIERHISPPNQMQGERPEFGLAKY